MEGDTKTRAYKRVVLFAGGRVGLEVAQLFRERGVVPVCLIYDAKEGEARFDTLISASGATMAMSSDEVGTERGREKLEALSPDLFILAWWPYLLRSELFEIAREGCINFHPSMLPYNRGKHTTFWSLIEQSPFGVTLHFINAGIDTGPIAFQRSISKSWEDTGKSLYDKARSAILELFAENFDTIVRGTIPRREQSAEVGSFHKASEIMEASHIALDREYRGRELLDLLRAKTFAGYSGAWFEEDGERYEVRVDIRKAGVGQAIEGERNPRKACPVCNSTRLAGVTERPNVPVHQNMLFETRLGARSANRGHLRVMACLDCGFVFNATFDGTLMSYGTDYESDQTYSPKFTSHVAGRVDLLLNRKGIRDARILEVGSGKGAFLRALVEASGSGNTGCGFDPSYVGPDTDLNGRLRFVRSFYTKDYEDIPADVAICRHVMEHVPDPVDLLSRIRRSSDSPRVFLETKDIKWVLRNAVIWDFFYEYCSYFSQRSLTAALHRAGFGEVISEHIFGGQYIWVEASVGDSRLEPDPGGPGVLEDLIMSYKLRENETRVRWRDTLTSLRSQGPVALWGAGAKGVTFASLFDPGAELISCVVDLNPAKQNRYIAGSGHAIVAPSRLGRIGVRNVILLNPNYADEVSEFLAREQLNVNLVVDADLSSVA
jgi:methionyl-tRNA formyltransferase/SAM-dependent methyltransferase